VWVGSTLGALQDKALGVVLLASLAGQESRSGRVLEHLTDALVGLGRALEVLVGANLLADLLALFKKLCQ
jgi:hypothetical protein